MGVKEALTGSSLGLSVLFEELPSAIFGCGLVALQGGDDSTLVRGVRVSIGAQAVAIGGGNVAIASRGAVSSPPWRSEAGWVKCRSAAGISDAPPGEAEETVRVAVASETSGPFPRRSPDLKRFCCRTDGAVGKKSAKPAEARDIMERWLHAQEDRAITKQHP